LTAADAALLEIVSIVRGATPTDRSKVAMPDDDKDEEDEFFGPH